MLILLVQRFWPSRQAHAYSRINLFLNLLANITSPLLAVTVNMGDVLKN